LKSIGQQIKILECLQHISYGRTDVRHFHIPRSALQGRGTIKMTGALIGWF